MSAVRRLLAGLLLLLAVAPVQAAPIRDWSKVATRLPSGDVLRGNPAARVKLVEILSLTCPHCAHFAAEGEAPLAAKYIRPGLVSYEVRVAVRDPLDLTAAVLARCGGPRYFFAVLPALFAAQSTWIGAGEAWMQTSPDLKGMSDAQAARAFAAGSGLDAFFAAHGLAKPRIAACIADTADARALSAKAAKIWNQPNFPGTPAFLIGGRMADGVRDWKGLDAALAAALR